MGISSAIFDAGIRLEAVIYIPGAVADCEATPEAFRDFCDDLPDQEGAPLYRQLPCLQRYAADGDYPEPEIVAEQLIDSPGFLVQAATPVREYHKSGDGTCCYSWGHYYTAWLYAATEADIVPVATEWAQSRHEADRAKAGAS
jgi:hypothetical protein